MKYFFIIFLFLINISFVHSAQKDKAYFAGGCFWCVEESFEKLEEKNRELIDQVKSVPDKEELLERSKELKQKIVSLNEQLVTQKMLIKGYESNQQIQLNSSGISEVGGSNDYKKLILELKREHTKF